MVYLLINILYIVSSVTDFLLNLHSHATLWYIAGNLTEGHDHAERGHDVHAEEAEREQEAGPQVWLVAFRSRSGDCDRLLQTGRLGEAGFLFQRS